MNLLNINLKPIYPTYYVYNNNSYNRTKSVLLKEPSYDVFVRSNEKIAFCGKTKNKEENEFKERFSEVIKKLAKEGVPCAYTGLMLISWDDYESIKRSQDLRKRSSVAIRRLKPYKDSMHPIEKKVFSVLEKESKKHPDLKLQQLLELEYAKSEKILIRKQAHTLDDISMLARNLPKSEFDMVRDYINKSFDKIFLNNPLPEDRFRRSDFIRGLSELEISNKKIKSKMLKIAEKLPKSSTSQHAFIVKYSQPYKIKYVDDVRVKVLREPDELALRLLVPSIASDDHIYPQTLFKAEKKARDNNEEYAKDLSSLQVTILTSQYINNQKGDTLIDDFIRINKNKYDIKANIQKHIDRLIEIDEKWLNEGNIKDSEQLADYIIVLKEEFERRSKLVKVDISELDRIISQIEMAKEQQPFVNYSNGAYGNQTRYSNFKYRKTQVHAPRYSK